jgi:hypothetical protein
VPSPCTGRGGSDYHLSPRVYSILGSCVRLYNKKHDWAGSIFRWFDLCKCYEEEVGGLEKDGLGLRLLAISLILVPTCFLAEILARYCLKS